MNQIIYIYDHGNSKRTVLSINLIPSLILYISRVVRKPVFGFPTRSDTNRSVQSQKMVRALKFWILKEEGLYYPCSENKGADQLCGYHETDLRLCFRICKKPVSHDETHISATNNFQHLSALHDAVCSLH